MPARMPMRETKARCPSTLFAAAILARKCLNFFKRYFSLTRVNVHGLIAAPSSPYTFSQLLQKEFKSIVMPVLVKKYDNVARTYLFNLIVFLFSLRNLKGDFLKIVIPFTGQRLYE
jgi:hypothetical protein